jgi:apolipoprotein N-acyltransferase
MSSAAGAPPSSSSYYNVLTFLVIVVLIVLFRLIRNLRGVRVSKARTIGYIIFYFAFGSLFIGFSFLEGVPYLFAIPDMVLGLIGAIFSYRLSDRRMTFWRPSERDIYYKGGIIVYLIYIAGLVARIVVDFTLIGASAFSFGEGAPHLSGTALIGSTVSDLLLAFGIGLLVGRNWRIYHRVKLIESRRETVPSTPQEYGQMRGSGEQPH